MGLMATRISSKLIQRLPHHLVRYLNSPSSSLSAAAVTVVPRPVAGHDSHTTVVKPFKESTTLNLYDDERLFSSKTTVQLLKSFLNLQLASFEPTADFGMWLMKSRLMNTVILRDVILATVKKTFYEHFCAGENLEEASQTLQGLWDDGLRGILDYGLEDANDNQSCDRNLNEFIKVVHSTSLLPPSSVSYACVKITAICPISLLKRVSDLLRWQHKDPTFQNPWKHDTFPILCNSSPFYHTLERPDPLTPEEERDLQQAHHRLITLSEKCLESNTPLLIDAEYTSVQPAIDYLTYSTMIKFNKHKNAVVFGTIQAYLKDAKQRMTQATQAAEKMGVTIGLKLVRGAYMSSESDIASLLGFSSPVHGTIQETHACYNDCTAFLIHKVSLNSAAVLLATHNLESGRVAIEKAQALGIPKGNQKLQFAQLKGMADGLSYSLRNAGFLVSKYLAYGPVEMVIPFLLRRAEENKGLLSASTLDRKLMRRELARRLKIVLRGDEVDKITSSANH